MSKLSEAAALMGRKGGQSRSVGAEAIPCHKEKSVPPGFSSFLMINKHSLEAQPCPHIIPVIRKQVFLPDFLLSL